MSGKIKIIIVDDHQIFRQGLTTVLSDNADFSIIGQAANGLEFLELLNSLRPDIVLMDISMPEMNGIEATKAGLEKNPDLKIIALSMYGDQEYYYKMIHLGVKGFVLKKSGKQELERAIYDVFDGLNFFSAELLRNIISSISTQNEKQNDKSSPVELSKREMEVLQLICSGLSNAEIADKLNVSVKTIDTHRLNLIAKTNTKNTVSLVMYAIKNKYITI